MAGSQTILEARIAPIARIRTMSVKACLSSVRVTAFSPDEKEMSPLSSVVKIRLLPSDSTVGALADAGAAKTHKASTATKAFTLEIDMVGVG